MLKFCILCQLPPPNKSPNFNTMALKIKNPLFNLIKFVDLGPVCHVYFYFSQSFQIWWLIRQLTPSEEPRAGTKCLPGLSSRPHGTALAPWQVQLGQKHVILKAIGICMAVWFDGFLKFENDRYVKKVYDLSYTNTMKQIYRH